MKKQTFLLIAVFSSIFASAQVGVNTETPHATLDIVGKPTDTSILDGVIAPRITGEQLRLKTYTTAQTGALVYVTLADTSPAGQTVDITSTGYYYFDGTKWIKTASATGTSAEIDGIIGNEILNATTNGGLVRSGSGTTADPYTLGITPGTAAGQVVGWNPGSSTWSPVDPLNIYNADGTLTGNRTLSTAGNSLTFNVNSLQRTVWSASNGSLNQIGLATSATKHASMNLTALDNNNNSVTSGLQFQIYPEQPGQITATNDATGLALSTNATTNSAPITFTTSAGSNAGGTEKMRITGIGNVGVNTSSPTEKFDNNGITRLRSLPVNGAANAIYTLPGGTSASANQDQTFTATKTLVADANGVVGYVAGIPSDAGSSKVLVIANAPGTQNVGGQFIPNAAIAQFTNESLDVYSAWTNNIFTVPANMGGVYIMVMQNSNTHVSTGTATPTWHTMAYYERSTDGGASWNTVIKHIYADLAGTIVDNGNTLYWTGFLNAGDQIRVRFSCNANTNNIVNYGGLSITKLAQ